MDLLTPRQRSHCMSRIRGKDTKPEMMLRRALGTVGLRYRPHHGVTGRPKMSLSRNPEWPYSVTDAFFMDVLGTV